MSLKQSHMWKNARPTERPFGQALLYAGLIFGILGEVYSTYADTVIQNPLGDQQQTIPQLLAAITAKLTPFIIVLATFSILVVGFQFVIAAVRGDHAGITKARTNLMWVLIGTAVVIGATAIATAVQSFLKSQ